MKYVKLGQGTEEWLAWRKEGITATDSAVILGLSPWKTPWRLWAEKRGIVQPEDLSGNPAVRFGAENEDRARGIWESIHGVPALPCCAECEGNPVFRASFDGLTPDDCPLEIKCPQAKTLEDVRTRGTESDAFRLYRIQVQHQLLVSGADHGWLVFLDGDRLIEFEIARDEALIGRILEEGAAFHESVLSGREPARDPQRDAWVPESDGERTLWEELSARFRRNEALLAMSEKMLEPLEPVRREQTLIRERLSELVQAKGFASADFDGVSVSRVTRKGSFDWKAFIAAKGIPEEELAPFFKESSVSWRIRCAQEKLPEALAVPETPPEPALPSQPVAVAAGIDDGSVWF